ncbi:hypothetical protein L207DRAFT_630876 [Hyaloscypha variabilis F]|uniref:Uncharacterized protein n=1 Tax=Hyaloscypha variabilis (strain UAMH 11265 / GT02V1 / F) TaxID=1149755 RepID=A0A2J6S1B4_HYAVF|nr:hypothetical protein L207DRAFT_630876 [Hyaloscypha variabilis F]
MDHEMVYLEGGDKASRWSTTSVQNLVPNDEYRHRKSGVLAALSRFLADGWGLETIGWIVSALFMAAIIVTLMLHNGKPLPEWPFTITINTLISVFSQIGQTALAIPVSACMAQLKWLWFTKERHQLVDFQDIDSASHSPLSSLLLLVKKRAMQVLPIEIISHGRAFVANNYLRALVSLGALITIAVLGFGPFTQQAVSFQERQIASGDAKISSLGNITRAALQGTNPDDANGVGGGYVSPSVVAAIYNGMTTTPSLSDVTPLCSTGNCTFDLYNSLAICAYPVANLTSQLTATAISDNADCSVWGTGSGNMCQYALPNGMMLHGSDAYMNISTTTTTVPSLTYSNDAILDFFVVYYSNASNSVQAVEGALRFCGQTYNTSVTVGTTRTVSTQTWGSLDMSVSKDESGTPIYSLIGGPNALSVDLDVFNAMRSALGQAFQPASWVNEVEDDGNQFFLTPNGQISVAAQALKATLYSTIDSVGALQNFTGDLSIALTNNLRTGIGSATVEGTEYYLQTYLLVRWDWLIFPVVLIVAALILLIATIIQSKRRGTGVWKASSLATLSALGGEAKGLLGVMNTASALSEAAEEMMVGIEQRGAGWRLDSKQL